MDILLHFSKNSINFITFFSNFTKKDKKHSKKCYLLKISKIIKNYLTNHNFPKSNIDNRYIVC